MFSGDFELGLADFQKPAFLSGEVGGQLADRFHEAFAEIRINDLHGLVEFALAPEADGVRHESALPFHERFESSQPLLLGGVIGGQLPQFGEGWTDLRQGLLVRLKVSVTMGKQVTPRSAFRVCKQGKEAGDPPLDLQGMRHPAHGFRLSRLGGLDEQARDAK